MPGIKSNTLSASPLRFANLRLVENHQSVGDVYCTVLDTLNVRNVITCSRRKCIVGCSSHYK